MGHLELVLQHRESLQAHSGSEQLRSCKRYQAGETYRQGEKPRTHSARGTCQPLAFNRVLRYNRRVLAVFWPGEPPSDESYVHRSRNARCGHIRITIKQLLTLIIRSTQRLYPHNVGKG